jgi:hypothetical protein
MPRYVCMIPEMYMIKNVINSDITHMPMQDIQLPHNFR